MTGVIAERAAGANLDASVYVLRHPIIIRTICRRRSTVQESERLAEFLHHVEVAVPHGYGPRAQHPVAGRRAQSRARGT
jgi:hypothetical protein